MTQSRQSPNRAPVLGASACLWRGDEVLLIQQAKPPRVGLWSLPGGHVEWGETIATAAMRELQEETALVATLDQLAGLFDIIRADADGAVLVHYVVACFAGLYAGGEAQAGSDAMAVRWVRHNDLQAYDLAPNILEAINTARKLLQL